MRLTRAHLTEPVTVRRLTGEGAYGPVLAAPVGTRCYLQAGRKLVRSRNGDEVVSEITLFVAPETDEALDLEVLFAPESHVAVRGREARVVESKPHLYRGRLVYLEVLLA